VNEIDAYQHSLLPTGRNKGAWQQSNGTATYIPFPSDSHRRTSMAVVFGGRTHKRDAIRERQPKDFKQGENQPALMCSTTGRKTRNDFRVSFGRSDCRQRSIARRDGDGCLQ
jgi:hypothetical protein